MRTRVADVLFVAMPFGPVFRPAFGVSLLQAALVRAGLAARSRYFSIRFSEIVGTGLYNALSAPSDVPTVALPGEWIFSAALFDRRRDDASGYIDAVLRGRSNRHRSPHAWRMTRAMIERIVRARRNAPAFLDWCVDQVAARPPRVVGLTSSFQQHTASLAFARRLKARLPGIPIVMGGANCEGAMGVETVRQFAFVDAVVSGEADLIIVDLVRKILDGRAVDDLPGVHTPASASRRLLGQPSNAPPVQDMDALPYPDYRDYLADFRRSRHHRGAWRPDVTFESSRGCWWGAKAHCTFCGLNGTTMAFRSKSAPRVIEELEHFARRYPGLRVEVVDNIIDMTYFADVLPRIAERGLDLDLFYETKSNLRKEQVRALARAGIGRIQPGIESLSDAVLTLMRKGVTWLQNVQLLKWCRELGIQPFWNVLWGFPGEPSSEYERMAAVVPWLTHLTPPRGCGRLRLDRFSPNFTDSERLGFTAVRPVESYRHIYDGLPETAIRNLAYYFQFDYADGRTLEYVEPMRRAVARWRRAHAQSELCSAADADRRAICDLRPSATIPLTILEGMERALYEACDAIADVRGLTTIARTFDAAATEATVNERLRPLVRQGLLLQDGARYLALAIPSGDYRPSAAAMRRLRDAVSVGPGVTRKAS